MPVTGTTFNVTLGAVLTAHLRNVRKGTPIEQAYLGTRVLSLMEKNRERQVDGGGYIHTQVSASQAAVAGPYETSDTITDTAVDEDTMAVTQLRFYSEPIKVYRSEVIKAGGSAGSEAALFSYVENKKKQAEKRLRVKIESDMLATSQVSKGVTSILVGMPADPTTGTVDGIDRSTQDWWRNQQVKVGSLNANFEKLEELSLACQKGGESAWDFALCDQTTFLRLKKLARTYLSLNAGTMQSEGGKRMADLGIPVIEFEGKPVTWTPRLGLRDWSAAGGSSSGGQMLFLKKSALQLVVVPDEEFQIEGPFPLEARDTPQHGMKWHIMWAGQVVWQEPSACGIAWDILA